MKTINWYLVKKEFNFVFLTLQQVLAADLNDSKLKLKVYKRDPFNLIVTGIEKYDSQIVLPQEYILEFLDNNGVVCCVTPFSKNDFSYVIGIFQKSKEKSIVSPESYKTRKEANTRMIETGLGILNYLYITEIENERNIN
jgi:hypothetical protein